MIAGTSWMILALATVTAAEPSVATAATAVTAGSPAPAAAAERAEAAIGRGMPLALEDCIAIALEKNLQLRIAQAELEGARGIHQASFAKFLPVLTGSAIQKRNEDRNLTVGAAGARVEARQTTVDHAVSGGISQQLPGGAVVEVAHDLGRTRSQPIRTESRGTTATLTQPLLRGAGPTVSLAGVRSSRLDVLARAQDLSDLERQTVLAVKVAYFNVVRDLELLRVNRATLEDDSLLVQASSAMVEAKVASRRDILSARIRLSDDVSSMVVAERDQQLSLDQLKDVMGIPLETAIAIADTGLEARIVAMDEAAIIRRVLETHPALRSARYAVSRSRLDRTMARNARLPQIDLQATVSSGLGTRLDVFDQTRSRGWLAAVNLRYPLLDRAAAGEAIQREAELSQAEHRLALIERQLRLRVRDIVRTARSSSEELQAIQRTIAAAYEKLQFATAMFNLGRASNLDITDARSDLVKARTQLVKKRVDYNSQLALLESLTGEAVRP